MEEEIQIVSHITQLYVFLLFECNIFSCMQRRTTSSRGKLRLLDSRNTEGIVRENPKNDDS